MAENKKIKKSGHHKSRERILAMVATSTAYKKY
jgi:hypothetical protein